MGPAAKSQAGGEKKLKKKLSGTDNFFMNNHTPVVGEDMVNQQGELSNPYGKNPFAIDIKKYQTNKEVIAQVVKYLRSQTSLHESTIIRVARYLRSMCDNEKWLFPINLLKPRVEQFYFHMNYYRDNIFDKDTGENFYGLKQKRDAFWYYLDACTIPRSYFPYKLPKQPTIKPIDFPNPDIAYKLTVFDYTKFEELSWSKEKTEYFQFAHLYNFQVGPRAPSEMATAKIGGINWDDCTLKFLQPKLTGKIRKITLPKAFVTGKTRKSLYNFVYHIRPKFVTQYSDDSIFINPWTGKSYWRPKESIDAPRKLSDKLSKSGKLAYIELNYSGEPFYPYMGRHFCCTGKLIEFSLEKIRNQINNVNPLIKTRNWMGHSEVKTTERYTQLAEQSFEKYPFNWSQRILKGDSYKRRGKYARNRNKLKLPTFRMDLLQERKSSPERGSFFALRETPPETKVKNKKLGFFPSSLNPSFFTFNLKGCVAIG